MAAGHAERWPRVQVQDFTANLHARQGELKQAFVFDYGPEYAYCRDIADVGDDRPCFVFDDNDDGANAAQVSPAKVASGDLAPSCASKKYAFGK